MRVFLGIPIALYAFGQAGFGYAVAFSAVSLVFNSILSQAVAVGCAQLGILLRTPLIYAIATGVLIQISGVQPPNWVGRGISLVGGFSIPLMLMMVGASVARIKVVTMTRALVFSSLRVIGGAAVGMTVGSLLQLSPVAQNVLILQCAMPVAVLSYIFAQRWNNEPDEIVSLVAVSTWSAAISVPLMLGLMIGAS
jgi:predicted permease